MALVINMGIRANVTCGHITSFTKFSLYQIIDLSVYMPITYFTLFINLFKNISSAKAFKKFSHYKA